MAQSAQYILTVIIIIVDVTLHIVDVDFFFSSIPPLPKLNTQH